MQRRVRFADDVGNGSPHSGDALPSILDALLAEYTLNQQQQQQEQQHGQITQAQRVREPELRPLSPPQQQSTPGPARSSLREEIAIELSQGEDDSSRSDKVDVSWRAERHPPFMSTEASAPQAHTASSVSRSQHEVDARIATPPSPVLSVREEEQEGKVALPPSSPSISSLLAEPLGLRRRPVAHAQSHSQHDPVTPAEVLLVASPSTSAMGSVTDEGALLRATSSSAAALTARGTGSVVSNINNSSSNRGNAAVGGEMWRVHAAENVQRLLRSSQRQVNELLALKPALEASERARRDLEQKLWALQEDATHARLELLQEKSTTHVATESLAQKNLHMQSTIQQLERDKAQLTEALRQAEERQAHYAQLHREQQAAREQAQAQATEWKRLADDARGVEKTLTQVTNERDHWQQACATTAQELAHARSENARLDAKLFELQRKSSEKRSVTSQEPSSLTTAMRGAQDVKQSSSLSQQAESNAWETEHVAFLRQDIYRLEALVREANAKAEVAQADLEAARIELAQGAATQHALSQRAETWEARYRDVERSREAVEQSLATAAQEGAAAAAEDAARWQMLAQALLGSLVAVAENTELDEPDEEGQALHHALDSLYALVQMGVDDQQQEQQQSDHAHISPSELSAALRCAVEVALRTLHRRAQRQTGALAQTQVMCLRAEERAQAAEDALTHATRSLSESRSAAQHATALLRAAQDDAHALAVLGAKYETVLANALREYKFGNNVPRGKPARARQRMKAEATPSITHTLSLSCRSEDEEDEEDEEDGNICQPDVTPSMTPSSVRGAATSSADGVENKRCAGVEETAASSLSQWQRQYQQLLILLTNVRHVTTRYKARLRESESKVARLAQQQQASQGTLQSTEKRLREAQERARIVQEKHAAQLAASSQLTETREGVLREEIGFVQKQLETARQSCESMRRRVQAMETRATEAEASLQASQQLVESKETEAQTLTGLLDAAKQALVVQKEKLADQAEKLASLRGAEDHHLRDTALVYHVLSCVMRYTALLLFRLDHTAALRAIGHRLYGTSTALALPPAVGETVSATSRAEASAWRALHALVSSVELVAEDGQKNAASIDHANGALVSPLQLFQSVVPPTSAESFIPLPSASPTATHAPRRHRWRLRTVVLVVLAIRRLVWASRWRHDLLHCEAAEGLALAQSVPQDAARNIRHRAYYSQGEPTRGPRVVFFEEDAQVGRRVASPPHRGQLSGGVETNASDKATACQRSHDGVAKVKAEADHIFDLLSPSTARHSVFALRDAVLPVVDVPPLAELVAALRQFFPERAGTRPPVDAPSTSSAGVGAHHNASVPAHTLVEYLLHRMLVRNEEADGVSAFWRRAHGVQHGGCEASLLSRLPMSPHPSASRANTHQDTQRVRQEDMEGGNSNNSNDSNSSSAVRVVARVRTLLTAAQRLQRTLLSRVHQREQDLALLAEQNADLGHALESREVAYEGIEASVEELEYLLRQRPAPEELSELRERLVAAQSALEKERQEKRRLEAHLAEQVEKEMTLRQHVQQLRNQNRVLHIEAARRGASVDDLDRLQRDLFRQSPPRHHTLPSTDPSFVTSRPEDTAAHGRGLSDIMNISKGAAPSTVPGCSEDDEDNDNCEERHVAHSQQPRHAHPTSQTSSSSVSMPHSYRSDLTGSTVAGGAVGLECSHRPPLPRRLGSSSVSVTSTWAGDGHRDVSYEEENATASAALASRPRLVVDGHTVYPAGVLHANTSTLPQPGHFMNEQGRGGRGPLTLYEPVTVNVSQSRSANTSMKAASTASTRTTTRLATAGQDSSPAPRLYPSGGTRGGGGRAPPVLDLQANSKPSR